MEKRKKYQDSNLSGKIVYTYWKKKFEYLIYMSDKVELLIYTFVH